jgi:HlyD family secretion protein
MKNLSTYIPFLFLLVSCSTNDEAADAYGSLEATEIFIASELPGKIVEMTTNEGEIVVPGTRMASLDTQSLYLQKQQIIASMNALKAQLTDVPVQLDVLKQKEKILERELKRIGQLVDDGAATSKQLDDLQGEYDVVQKQLTATKSQLSTANRAILAQLEPMDWQLKNLEDKIKRATISTPQKGTVLKRYKEAGEIVAPGIPLYKIADISLMTARVYVSGTQLNEIRIGQQVIVKADLNKDEMSNFDGTVQWIADEAEFTPKTIQTKEERVNLVYAVKIAVPNPEGQLKIGMPIEVNYQ